MPFVLQRCLFASSNSFAVAVHPFNVVFLRHRTPLQVPFVLQRCLFASSNTLQLPFVLLSFNVVFFHHRTPLQVCLLSFNVIFLCVVELLCRCLLSFCHFTSSFCVIKHLCSCLLSFNVIFLCVVELLCSCLLSFNVIFLRRQTPLQVPFVILRHLFVSLNTFAVEFCPSTSSFCVIEYLCSCLLCSNVVFFRH